MTFFSRKTCFLLLLIVTVSHVALTLHATSHVTNDQSCQICAHFSHLEHASAPTLAFSIPLGTYVPDTVTEPLSLPTVEPAHYHQRAPPFVA